MASYSSQFLSVVMYNTLKTGLSALKRSAVTWQLAGWLVLYWSRLLDGDKWVNVEKQAYSIHLLINGLKMFCVHTYT